MAFALAEILKSAQQTTDAQLALGTTVIEAKRRLAAKAKGTDNQPTWAYELEKPAPGAAKKAAPGVPEPAAPKPPPPPRPTDGSIDVEFSAPDLDADPLPLTTRKKT
jgi:hypothetical protein